MSMYTIQPGDTFSSVATKLGADAQTLEKLSPGVQPESLQIGQVINVLRTFTTNTYTVQPSDTFSSIATALVVDVQTLELLQVINVPTGSPAPNPNPLSSNGYSDFTTLLNLNSTLMLNDTQDIVDIIGYYIPFVSSEFGVDARVILYIIMQESGGNIYVASTTSPPPDSITNTGIMRAHDGSPLNRDNPGTSALTMTGEGTGATSMGDGLKRVLAKWGNWYEAFRAYNSGSVNQSNLSDGLGATDLYASDVANRLQGHVWPGM